MGGLIPAVALVVVVEGVNLTFPKMDDGLLGSSDGFETLEEFLKPKAEEEEVVAVVLAAEVVLASTAADDGVSLIFPNIDVFVSPFVV